jgi:adenylate cyclase
MKMIAKHWQRIVFTLIPLVIALLHAVGVMSIGVFQRLDDIIYDARLRATMPKTLDDRIVIVDIDEKSLSEVGQFPWGRNKLAQLVDALFDQQGIALLGFDIVFAEPDDSSGLGRLVEMARNEFKDHPGFAERVRQLQPELDYDSVFARALDGRAVVLGYYFTSDRGGRVAGDLPPPVLSNADIKGRMVPAYSFSGYGANIAALTKAAPLSGHFNPVADRDGVVRSVPLLAEYKGQFYESLSLAMFRRLFGSPSISLGFSDEKWLSRNYQGLERISWMGGQSPLSIPVDSNVATLIPFRGLGGANGGSFRYISASDVLAGRLPNGSLKDKIVLVGTTAPGLLDLRATPVGETYPGVESHASVISAWLDNRVTLKPDYAQGYDILVLTIAGLLLAVGLPLLSATRAMMLSIGVLFAVTAINTWLYLAFGLVMPLAAAIVMNLAAFALNMSYGYFVESKSKRELAHLFGTYVPPELVDEMVKDPDSYSMKATSRELTVMFCDMRGFTKMSEHMEPTQLQELLTGVFSNLTRIIRANRGTIDKYMGDCVMAFWGAPVDTPDHAHLAVKSAIEMAQAVRDINIDHRARGLPDIGIGIGINTGTMCVGDMGSNIRRAYTVIGDSVNLGSRLEGLSKTYGIDIVVSEATRKLASKFAWQELDRVRVKGKEQAVAIFWPVAPTGQLNESAASEIKTWAAFMKAYRAQNWDQADVLLINLMRMNAKKYLYQLYADRVASMRLLPFDPAWDGATNFETK